MAADETPSALEAGGINQGAADGPHVGEADQPDEVGAGPKGSAKGEPARR